MNSENEKAQGNIENKKSNKTLLIIVILLLAIACVIAGLIFLNNDTKKNEIVPTPDEELRPAVDIDNKQNVKIENNVKTNVSKKLNEKHTFDFIDNNKITIDNISLKADANTGDTTFKFSLTSSVNIEAKAVGLSFVDKDGNSINGYEITIENIAANDAKEITLTFRDDFSNAYDFIMEV